MTGWAYLNIGVSRCTNGIAVMFGNGDMTLFFGHILGAVDILSRMFLDNQNINRPYKPYLLAGAVLFCFSIKASTSCALRVGASSMGMCPRSS